ncbi:helix-turn-helix domain-containing protein [Micromonospora sp. NBC_01813]|uniref:helix-turn-helix domain-containing protein n=1 Tax=Micromonospora sp. NBC_01813 TaxID=2975988 RepID=UPI002DDA5098|nr:helix-turn-helix domain-containing protein [Micromonospora sp. NBC_01813]WSA07081.1 hypothetical protein OG958_22835 [Micromonospora sp. NBC_01813]
MTAPEFDALRARRREVARQLRAEGLPVRQIAARLGVSHPTVIEDLREVPAMTTTSATTTDAVPVPPRFDERNARLTMLLDALDGLGLGGMLGESRALLARAADVERAAAEGHSRARSEVDGLVSMVADGTLPLDQAAVKAAALAPWEPWVPRPVRGRDNRRTPAWSVADRVAGELRERARLAAKAAGLDVHGRLSQLAAGAVKRGVEAGRHLVDVPAVLEALKPPKVRPGLIQAGPQASDPFAGRPRAKLPARVRSVDDIQGNGPLMGWWAEATSATEELTRLHDVAGLLHAVAGGASSVFAVDPDSDKLVRVNRDLPPQVHLAVVDALGWGPGLHMALKAVPSRSFAGRVWDAIAGAAGRPSTDGVEVVNGVRQPAGWSPPVSPRVGA